MLFILAAQTSVRLVFTPIPKQPETAAKHWCWALNEIERLRDMAKPVALKDLMLLAKMGVAV